MTTEKVLIVGGGVAGMSAALQLADMGFRSRIIEAAPFLGGHAVQYSCKATDRCVKCGACMVEERLHRTLSSAAVEVWTDSRVQRVSRNQDFELVVRRPADPSAAVKAGAVILACGFKAFDPVEKPYGYGKFEDVITNLELERTLRARSVPVRPSDGALPRRIGFVQCVGSRDSRLGHLWCSRICCGSALRTARLIRMRCPDTEIAFFYIDVQTFGNDFDSFYATVHDEVHMIRYIPGDVFATPEKRLKVVYYDPTEGRSREEPFDLLVLSVAMTPSEDAAELANQFQIGLDPSGFLPAGAGENRQVTGVFTAGAACGPMSIAESVASGEAAAFQAALYLRQRAQID
jgi:heterodisulfide reductase subunit A